MWPFKKPKRDGDYAKRSWFSTKWERWRDGVLVGRAKTLTGGLRNSLAKDWLNISEGNYAAVVDVGNCDSFPLTPRGWTKVG